MLQIPPFEVCFYDFILMQLVEEKQMSGEGEGVIFNFEAELNTVLDRKVTLSI